MCLIPLLSRSRVGIIYTVEIRNHTKGVLQGVRLTSPVSIPISQHLPRSPQPHLDHLQYAHFILCMLRYQVTYNANYKYTKS